MMMNKKRRVYIGSDPMESDGVGNKGRVLV